MEKIKSMAVQNERWKKALRDAMEKVPNPYKSRRHKAAKRYVEKLREKKNDTRN